MFSVLSVLLLEGIGRQLDPDLDLFKSAIPILRRVGMQMNASRMDRSTFGSMAKVEEHTILGEKVTKAEPVYPDQIYLWAEIRNLATLSIEELDGMLVSGM